jgi:hypothetical protein
MDILGEKLKPQLPIDRVTNIDLIREVVECCLCHGLLWQPVACKECETPFCSKCIQEFHATKSESVCPHCCSPYIGRNPLAITRILTTLNVICRYKSNGCAEISPYNELENHEEICNYQLLSCIGCEQGIIKKDFDEHKNQCLLLLITCNECLTSYKRKDKDLHTLTECLRIQLQQEKVKIKQLEIKGSKQQTKIDLIEQKLKEYDNLWATFFQTTNQVR